jgi:hypothetical protein
VHVRSERGDNDGGRSEKNTHQRERFSVSDKTPLDDTTTRSPRE